MTTAGNPAQNDGFPQSWDLPGDADLFLRRNAKGQIEALSHGTQQPAAQAPTTATEDGDNLTLYLGYDAQGRLQTSTDPRGLKLTRAYQGESGVINTVTAGNPNNADNLLLQTENSGSGVSSARRTQRSWLGDEVAIHRGTENPFQTDLIRNGRITRFSLDPATERLKQLTNFEGETTQFAWHEADRRVDITGPDNSNSRLYYDADGQFEALTVQKPDGSYAVQNAVLRDAHNRVQAVYTPTRTTLFQYDGLNLSNIIDTEGRRIHYAEYNEAGRPLRLTVERDTQKQADLAVAYHNNGQPRCITLRPSAGHPERFHFNALGDLIRHERPHRAASEVQFNAWGAPQSLTYDAGNGPETHLLFAEGDNRVLQFPNQVFAEVDTQGRVTTLGYPGLAPKTTDYDAESRPVVISEGNHPARRIAWRDGRVDFLIAEAPVHPAGGTPISETITPAYDATGRVVQLTHADGSGEQFVYPAGSEELTRLESFTDANGVTQSYRTNLNRLTGVQIEGGPSPHYSQGFVARS
ncbi:RHS repeat protein [Acanthopleuribacter pedis]|uniref:RHS repeat protein n=1 Tax=Acanthopleuribacter pedis TaxID=442870 RepID=A0A8J7QAA6_9BACT|nr:RHS repeat protein [Acanthopleuribacter pedis]MBO1321706.1 RHS repeat protein [Acanthopleuribacter pedis]